MTLVTQGRQLRFQKVIDFRGMRIMADGATAGEDRGVHGFLLGHVAAVAVEAQLRQLLLQGKLGLLLLVRGDVAGGTP
jgi:hypothetical protein